MRSWVRKVKTRTKEMKRIDNWMLILLIGLCLAACGSASHFQKAETPEGKGLVYIYRPEKFFYSGLEYPVNANGFKIDTLENGGYITYIAKPGRIQFSARNEITSYVTLDVEPGKTYYIRGTTRPGSLIRRPLLQLVSPETGENEIAACSQIGEHEEPPAALSSGSDKHKKE